MKLIQALAFLMMVLSVFTVATPPKPAQLSNCRVRCMQTSLHCGRDCAMLPGPFCKKDCQRRGKECESECERRASLR